ncbi:MAG: cytochrome c-type biogenesis CcmF C-terminal domain-containing protein [Thermodesulfobacteriota bacterium]
MHLVGYFSLLFAMLASLILAGLALYAAWSDRPGLAAACEKGHLAAAALMTAASAVLLKALVVRDFSFQYVASYTDTFLPLFYAVTAFWAGQAGSLLFWAWTVALMGAVFMGTRAYAELAPATKAWYWVLFLSVQAFFLVLLTGPANPFLALSPPAAEGNGLNPLLRNPGMIFHPPLLFLGYAGFTIPACLGLASWAAAEPRPWLGAGRTWALVSWVFLTAGIVLGGWWSYMELGWGGYWAWDPVENASLIPWLSATAFLHTALIEDRRGALHRTNLFLMSLTLLLCFFATYLVRSGIIESLHAFGSGGMDVPLVSFLLLGLGATLLTLYAGQAPGARQLSGLASRQGVLVMAVWLLLAIGAVVMLGTMWPVISKLWSDNPVGLGEGFYNRVCLPLFALLALFLAVCPWLGWKGGIRHKSWFWTIVGVFAAAAALLFSLGVRLPVPLLAAAAALAVIAGVAALLLADPAARAARPTWGALGTHLGLALVVLGIAISGPYKVETEVTLKKGEPVHLGAYALTLEDSFQTSSPAMAVFQAKIKVEKDGKPVGELTPERRMYRGFDQPFAEVSTIPGLGDEVYATVLAFERDGSAAVVKASVNPLVNWIWIGGTIMCLLPFVGLNRRSHAE